MEENPYPYPTPEPAVNPLWSVPAAIPAPTPSLLPQGGYSTELAPTMTTTVATATGTHAHAAKGMQGALWGAATLTPADCGVDGCALRIEMSAPTYATIGALIMAGTALLLAAVACGLVSVKLRKAGRAVDAERETEEQGEQGEGSDVASTLEEVPGRY